MLWTDFGRERLSSVSEHIETPYDHVSRDVGIECGYVGCGSCIGRHGDPLDQDSRVHRTDNCVVFGEPHVGSTECARTDA